MKEIIKTHTVHIRELTINFFIFIVQVLGSTTLKDNSDLALQAW